MGLDMTLYGVKHFWDERRDKDDLEIASETVALGYWRKHPNLHGFIVKHYAEGVDECQRIELEVANLKMIIAATLGKDLPETEGFFFGKSQPEHNEATLRIMMRAIKWLETEEPKETRSVYYQASW